MTIRANDIIQLKFRIDETKGLTLDIIRAKMRKARQRQIEAGDIVKTIWSGSKGEYLLICKPREYKGV
jgi:replicative DNA helicase